MKVLRMRSWNFHAENLDQMAKFYQQALGAEVTAQQTIAGVKVFRLRAGETGLGLFEAAEKRGQSAELQKELDSLFTSQNQATDGTTSIPATFLRVTVEV